MEQDTSFLGVVILRVIRAAAVAPVGRRFNFGCAADCPWPRPPSEEKTSK